MYSSLFCPILFIPYQLIAATDMLEAEIANNDKLTSLVSDLETKVQQMEKQNR